MDRSQILQRFEQLLDTAMAEEGPPLGIPPEILAGDAAPESSLTDWHTIWAAMTTLTQEIKLQGRAFKQLSESLATEAERRGRKESLGALLEMRERLLRGLEGLRGHEDLRPGFWDLIFTRRWRKVEHALGVVRAMEEGYRLSLGYLDDLLFQFQVQPIECEGRPFDPRRMNAVDVEETGRAAEGTVLFVYRAGYEWNGELYRPAQVRVAKRPGNGGMQ
ncbi:MAG TPA: nucleotide exchange factor GrpE [Terriglobales bacterium]|nr:nucleotide exchange factor GrpE [Terriglobales bacterium]